jgi:phage virion morphogenesis protein
MIQIDIQIKGEALLAKLKEAEGKLDNLSEPLNEVGLYMEMETRMNFARQSDPDGAPWASLAASTAARKGSSVILRETGSLAGGIASEGASGNQVVIRSTGGHYGIYHQTGTKKMPARKFIGIGDRHKPKIKKIIESYVKEALS